MPNQVRWPVWQIGCAYVGTVVGAGFASGQEILQFFGRFGVWGYVAVALSAVLFAWLGYRVMMLGHRFQARSFVQVNIHVFGSTVGTVVNAILLIMLFGLAVAMLAGAGALFRERAGIPFSVGALATAVIAYMTVLRGISGVLRVNSIIVPTMTLFTVVSVGASLWNGGGQSIARQTTASPFLAMVSAVVYSAFNVGLSAGVLIPLGAAIPNARWLFRGSLFGASALSLMVGAILIALNANPSAIHYQVPMAQVAANFGPLMQWLFVVVLWGEIYSTLVGDLFAIVAHAPRRHFHAAAAGTLTAAFLLSHVGFSNIVHYAYTAFGWVSLMLLFAPLWPRRPLTSS